MMHMQSSFTTVVMVDILTQVTNEQVLSVYGLLNVDGCVLGSGWWGGHEIERREHRAGG